MLLFNHRSFLGARFVLTLALLAGLFGVVPVSPVYAATITVPDNYSTIQAAINAAHAGDTIVVRAGTYSENLTINKDLILTAASFDSNDPTRNTTIINAKSSTRPVITIAVGLLSRPTVRGFIIRNGIDNITVASEAIIEHNYFIGSTDQLDFRAGGGGIVRHNVFFDSQDDAIDLDNMNRPLLIEHNRLMYNRDDGIEVRLQDATAPALPITITISKNEIIGCDEDGIQFIDYAQAVDTKRNFTITDNLIANCRFAGIGLMGNAISVEDYSGANIIESIQVYNNTIYGNDYGISGGDNLIAHNNIIANSLTKGAWRVQGPAGASSVVAYTLFYNNGTDADQSTLGAGNKFGQNPIFVSAPNAGPDGVWRTVDDDFGGLALQSGSPAIDAGYDPSCPATDLLGVPRPQGVHCDLGAFEGQTSVGPTVVSVDSVDANPTSVSSVQYTVTFSEPVLNVDESDFTLTITGGITSATVNGVSGSGTTYTVTVNTGSGDGTLRLDVPVSAIIYDLDGNPLGSLPFTSGDVYTVMKPVVGNWYIYGQGTFYSTVDSTVDDIQVVADYNGDGKADIAVFRPSTSTWYIYGVGNFLFGMVGDIPVVADYNGDGQADIAVFRPSNSTWYIAGVGNFLWGGSGDIPVVADYNGDGKADIAVFRPSNSTWYIAGVGNFLWGSSGDIPVVGDYNGDGQADIAVFRPSNSTWYIAGVGNFLWGGSGDIPVVADYNGDGKADIAVFRPSNGTWYIYGVGIFLFGMVGDIPVVADYNGDGKADIAVFRP
jgi:hypothetical protein